MVLATFYVVIGDRPPVLGNDPDDHKIFRPKGQVQIRNAECKFVFLTASKRRLVDFTVLTTFPGIWYTPISAHYIYFFIVQKHWPCSVVNNCIHKIIFFPRDGHTFRRSVNLDGFGRVFWRRGQRSTPFRLFYLVFNLIRNSSRLISRRPNLKTDWQTQTTNLISGRPTKGVC